MTLPTDVREEINDLIQSQFHYVALMTLRKLTLKADDVLHVSVGGDIGGDVPYVPSEEEVAYVRDGWERVLPAGVKLIVTHHLMDTEVVQADA